MPDIELCNNPKIENLFNWSHLNVNPYMVSHWDGHWDRHVNVCLIEGHITRWEQKLSFIENDREIFFAAPQKTSAKETEVGDVIRLQNL